MYGKGNYAQFGQGSRTSTPPLQQQPHAPTPPPFQGPPGQRPHGVMPPNNVNQTGAPTYHHVLPTPVQQGPTVQGLPSGMMNSSHSYLTPPGPPQEQASTSMSHSYPSPHLNLQWTQNVHHNPPPGPSPFSSLTAPSHPEVLYPPPPPRVLPPPPSSQGQALHNTLVHASTGGVQGLPNILPPPPSQLPPTFINFTPQDSHVPTINCPPLPPPPVSPPRSPPLPPSSPSPRYSPSHLSGKYVRLGLPASPEKPADNKVVHKIEVLCQFIAKNGPEFENMTRQKEFGNPDFKFLFGSEPGSEAAVAHEYFLWMRKKCMLENKLDEEHPHSNSQVRPLTTVSSVQSPDALPSKPSEPGSLVEHDGLMDAIVCHSPADSDMEMEDDITQPDDEQRINKDLECQNQSLSASAKFDAEKQLDAEWSSLELNMSRDATPGSLSSLVTVEKGCKNSQNHYHPSSGPSLTEVSSSVAKPTGAVVALSKDKLEKSSVPNEDLGQLNVSTAAAEISFEKVPGQLISNASPFRLLQDYESDDCVENADASPLEDVNPVRVPSSAKAGASNSSTNGGCNAQTYRGSKGLSESERHLGSLSELIVRSPNMPIKALDCSIEPQRIERGTEMPGIAPGKAKEHGDIGQGNQDSVNVGNSHEIPQGKNAFDCDVVDAAPKSVESRAKDKNSTSTQLKVDELGRLIREDASDSDSGDLRYNRRRGRRGRSRSRSISPRERRRRSPWRRKERRSRSNSWSPRKRRSRSRSPFWRGGDFSGDRVRRNQDQLKICFDFRRGKCYRGVQCRYMHDDFDRSNTTRRYKSKHTYQEISHSSKFSEFHEEIEMISSKKSEHNEVKSEEMKISQVITESNVNRLKEGIFDEKSLVTKGHFGQAIDSDRNDDSLVIARGESEKPGEVVVAELQEAQNIRDENLQDDLLHALPSSSEHSFILHSQANTDHQRQQMDDPSTSDFSPVRTSTAILCKLPNIPHPTQISSLPENPDTTSATKPFSSKNVSSQPQVPYLHHPSHLPPPPSALSQGSNGPFTPQLPQDYRLTPPVAKVPSNSAPIENSTDPGSLSHQHSHFSVQPNSSCNFLPVLPAYPPRPSYNNDSTFNVASAPHGVSSLKHQHSQQPAHNDFPSQMYGRPYLSDLPPHAELHYQRDPPMPEPDRSLSHVDDIKPRILPVSNPMNQSFGGPNLIGEDRFSQLPQGLIPSNSFVPGSMHPQSFQDDNLPPAASLKSHPHLQPPSYHLRTPAADSFPAYLAEPGKIGSALSRHTSEILDRDQPSRASDFGVSRFSGHYNPYASTFDKPLSSRFSSNVSSLGKDALYGNLYGVSLNVSCLPVDGQGFGSLNLRNMISSPNSAHAVEQILPRSGGDQYDPLFDSIEPSSYSIRKADGGQKCETTDDSDVMLRFSGSNKPLDVGENKKQEGGAFALTTSLENDEFGETADAEVGAVENESPSSPLDVANPASGEIEIDQVKKSGKSKKSKDSRSMKLFKVALADFVKEVLKPSWRQGNMSKEAFKTIVKKTVDKVSGAMKGHHVPKSQAKINQYIDSSQRKLTKLVMGYVDKYVKV